MPTPQEQQQLDLLGRSLGDSMRDQMGHRWALSVLLTALTRVMAAILANNKLTYDELFERIDNAVKTWKLAFAPLPEPDAPKAKAAKLKSTKLH